MGQTVNVNQAFCTLLLLVPTPTHLFPTPTFPSPLRLKSGSGWGTSVQCERKWAQSLALGLLLCTGSVMS